jgi:hypothetical protein
MLGSGGGSCLGRGRQRRRQSNRHAVPAIPRSGDARKIASIAENLSDTGSVPAGAPNEARSEKPSANRHENDTLARTECSNDISSKADDYDAVRKALDDAGSFVGGLWLSFVSLATYLLVVVWSVTHQQLFLETPIKLPLVDVSLPLYGFFLVAPLFFLAMQAYLLLHLTSLADKVDRYNDILSRISDPIVLGKLRSQIPSLVPINLFSSANEKPKDLPSFLFRGIGWLTIASAPLILLLLVQWRFLPYQDQAATWVHRLAILVELALLCTLWLPIIAPKNVDWRRDPKWFAGVGATVGVTLLTTFILFTFPGEAVERFSGAAFLHEHLVRDVEWQDGNDKNRRIVCSREMWEDHENRCWLDRTSEARRWINGTLKLSEFSVVDEEKLEKMTTRTASAALEAWRGERTFRIAPGRSMRFADLAGADLRRTDLRGADLRGANLSRAVAIKPSLKIIALPPIRIVRAPLASSSLAACRLASLVSIRQPASRSTFRPSRCREDLDYAATRGAAGGAGCVSHRQGRRRGAGIATPPSRLSPGRRPGPARAGGGRRRRRPCRSWSAA